MSDITETNLYNKRIFFSWTPEEQYKWRLESPKSIKGYVIPAGFECDLTSIPRVLYSVLPKWSDYARAALLHDYLYRMHITTRLEADQIFLKVMEEDGVNAVQRNMIYYSVRWFGGKAWKENSSKS